MKIETLRRTVKIYNEVYLVAMVAWMVAWWLLGFKAWTEARFSPGLAIFISFAWMPFGVVQLFLIQAGLKAEIAAVRRSAEEMRVVSAQMVQVHRALVEQYGDDIEINVTWERPTIQ